MKKLLITILMLSSVSAMAETASQVTYTEINGVKWSQVLSGRYQNLDLDGTKPINRIIQKSEATVACSVLGDGWHLPTKVEFETLGSDYNKIPGAANYWFWTSTVGSNNPDADDAFVFDSNFAGMFLGNFRYIPNAVVCVGGR